MAIFPTKDSILIREVWKHNLDYEFAIIQDLISKYPFIAMDTEFPGFISQPENESVKEAYQAIKSNVDTLNLVQLGLTFFDSQGNLPTCGTDKHFVWQFNFCEFDADKDPRGDNSIEFLQKHGINLKKNHEEGVPAVQFSKLMISCGIVLNKDMRWITFHGRYDFAYLLKVLTQKNLPNSIEDFINQIKTMFVNVYDVKHLMGIHKIKGGLDKLVRILRVPRIGGRHQAGADSLLTCFAFIRLKELYFPGSSTEEHAGVVFELGNICQV